MFLIITPCGVSLGVINVLAKLDIKESVELLVSLQVMRVMVTVMATARTTRGVTATASPPPIPGKWAIRTWT